MQRSADRAVVGTCMQRRSHLRVHSSDDALGLARERLARGEHLAPSGRWQRASLGEVQGELLAQCEQRRRQQSLGVLDRFGEDGALGPLLATALLDLCEQLPALDAQLARRREPPRGHAPALRQRQRTRIPGCAGGAVRARGERVAGGMPADRGAARADGGERRAADPSSGRVARSRRPMRRAQQLRGLRRQLRARHGDQLIMKLLLPRQRRRAVVRTVRMQQPLARAGQGHVQQLVRPANGRELLLRGLGTLALHLGLGARLGEFLSELSSLAGRILEINEALLLLLNALAVPFVELRLPAKLPAQSIVGRIELFERLLEPCDVRPQRAHVVLGVGQRQELRLEGTQVLGRVGLQRRRRHGGLIGGPAQKGVN